MNSTPLSSSSWSVLRISGPDSRTFLQGQLSNDVDQIDQSRAGFFALCTPKGRTVSNFLLAPAPGGDEDTLLFLLPSDIADSVTRTLAKYIVFSKADIEPAEALQLRCIKKADQALLDSLSLSAPGQQAWACSVSDDAVLIRCSAAGSRCLLIDANAGGVATLNTSAILSENDWQLADIRDGIGYIRAASSDEYVPQMLNMQLTEGISFTKGCYTGQEIVARAQYRGKIKRRMYRLGVPAGSAPEIGMEINDSTGKTLGAVISAARISSDENRDKENLESGFEILAVLSLKGDTGNELQIAGQPLQLLDLPYDLDAESTQD